MNPDDANAKKKFQEVQRAYEVLSDPAKRKKYDELRTYGGGFGPFTTPGRPGGAGGSTTFDINDFLGGQGGGGGGFSDIFGTMFGGGGRTRQQAPRRGQDIETEATISFADSIEGVTVSLRLSSDAPCGDCNGTGARSGTVPRRQCLLRSGGAPGDVGGVGAGDHGLGRDAAGVLDRSLRRSGAHRIGRPRPGHACRIASRSGQAHAADLSRGRHAVGVAVAGAGGSGMRALAEGGSHGSARVSASSSSPAARPSR